MSTLSAVPYAQGVEIDTPDTSGIAVGDSQSAQQI